MRLDGPGQPADLSLGEEDLELLEYHRYMIASISGFRSCEKGA